MDPSATTAAADSAGTLSSEPRRRRAWLRRLPDDVARLCVLACDEDDLDAWARRKRPELDGRSFVQALELPGPTAKALAWLMRAAQGHARDGAQAAASRARPG